MTQYFLRRLLLIVPTFIGATLIVFGMTRVVPGGPLEQALLNFRLGSQSGGEGGGGGATARTDLPQDVLEALKRQFNLDKPWYVAYVQWLGQVATFDLGKSWKTGKPVTEELKRRFPISLTFGLTGFVLAYLICIPLGIAKALRHGTKFDFASSAAVFVGYSIPGWAMGALLIVFLSSGRFWDLFPLGGVQSTRFESLPRIVQTWEDPALVVNEFDEFDWRRLSTRSKLVDRAYHLALPVFCFMLVEFAVLTVLTKNSLMENLGQDYVRTAFAKGLSPRRVIYLHALRNSLIPLATGLGHALSVLMAGSYLIEVTFGIDGIGKLGFTALVGRDYMVVLGVLAINTLLTLFGNIVSDFLYALIDPRIRFQ